DPPVHHERMLRAQPGERPGDERRAIALGHTNHLAAHAGGVGERPEQVHDRRDRELASYRRRVLHRGMEVRREQKRDARFPEDARRLARVEADVHAQGFQHGGRAAAGRERAVAWLSVSERRWARAAIASSSGEAVERDGWASGIGISGSPKLPGKIAFCQMGQRVAWLDWPFLSSYLSPVAPVAPATSRPCLAV